MAKPFTKHFGSLKEAEDTLLKWGYQLNRSKTKSHSFVYDKVSDENIKQAIVKASHKGYTAEITTLESK